MNITHDDRTSTIRVGVVIRRLPAVSPWIDWVWRPVALLPGAPDADWVELRREGEAVEFHAATVTLELHRAETEPYRVALSNQPPLAWVILRQCDEPGRPEMAVWRVTASPYEAQDALDSGEEVVEAVPMPPALIAFVDDFVSRHHVEEAFVKRQRDRVRLDRSEDGRGDPRVQPEQDVFLSPGGRRSRLQ